MRFIKMHGCGNDYIIVDALAEPLHAERSDLPELARAMCCRHTGIGADGIIVLSLTGPRPDRPSADLSMRIINSDGTDGGMCGNGARCAAKFVVDRGYVVPSDDGGIVMEVGDRVLDIRVLTDAHGLVAAATVDMGRPDFDPKRVPFDPKKLEPAAGEQEGMFMLLGRAVHMVGMGNPHAVAFVDEPVDEIDLAREGPLAELHEAFPERVNVHVVHIDEAHLVTMRSWERGAGLTQACGSGACAVVAVGVQMGLTAREVRVRMPGGEVEVRQDEHSGHLLLHGPAAETFQGDWTR